MQKYWLTLKERAKIVFREVPAKTDVSSLRIATISLPGSYDVSFPLDWVIGISDESPCALLVEAHGFAALHGESLRFTREDGAEVWEISAKFFAEVSDATTGRPLWRPLSLVAA